RGVAIGLFAPDEPTRRVIVMENPEAESYASHLIWASRVFGLAIFVNVVHHALDAPVASIVATDELSAFAIVAITFHQLWRSAQADFRAAPDGALSARRAWFRAILWIAGTVITVALATGYVGLAVFFAGRMLAIAALGGAVVIVLVFVDTLQTERL